MNTNISHNLIVSVLLCLLAVPVAADLIDDLARNPEVRAARISPTGEYLAVMKEEEAQNVVAVFTFPEMKLINVIDFPGKNEVGRFWWVNNERILVSVAIDWDRSEEDVGHGELYAVNADGKRGKYLYGRRGNMSGKAKSRTNQVTTEYAAASFLHPLWDDPKKVLIRIGQFGRGFKSATTVAKLDIYSGRVTEEVYPPTANADILTDSQGNVRFSYYLDDDQATVIHQRDPDTGRWKEFSRAAYGESQIVPLEVNDDGDIFVRASNNDGPEGLYLMDPATQKLEVIVQHPYVSLDGLDSDYNGDVYGARFMPDRYEQYFLSEDHPNVQLTQALKGVFPNAMVLIGSTTHDFSLSVVRPIEDVRTPEFYLYDRNTNQLRLLFDAMPWVDDSLLSPMQPIEVEARDGLMLRGYLTVPKGAEPKNLPLVIIPHGGPHGPRDEWGYQWFEGFVPAAGYATLRINYRGSGGYGLEFEKAGHRNWPTKMQDDLTDSVQWAIDQGIADPDRICIFGWSYGGYAAAMSITREPDLYKCSVAGAGVYDQEVQYNQADFADRTRWGKKYMDKVIGPTKEDRRLASPVTYVDKIKTPMLLVHGEDDARVPVEHAYELQKAMKAAGKPVPRLIELKNERHTPRNEENNVFWYRETIKFIAEHIGPGVPPKG